MEQLKDRQRKDAGVALEEMATSLQASAGDKSESLEEEDEVEAAVSVSGDWSPRLLHDISELGDVTILDPTEDWKELVISLPTLFFFFFSKPVAL